MKPRNIILSAALWLAPAALPAADAPRPNIIFIITDDQGYGDLSCHGNPVLKTPNIDRLHDGGVSFEDFHVSPTCSPTRSALMTGRHEFKNGVTHTIRERERLTLQATTIAQVLKSAGYTTGIFGKWHLGDEDAYQPDKRGFDEVFIHGGGGIGQSYPGSCGDAPGNRYFDPYIKHNGRFEKTNGYCTDVFFGQAAQWMESVKGDKPFFCYIATNAPHAPLQVRPEDEARYAGKVPSDTAKFFGMIANIDDNVGRLLERLKKWGIERDTLVVFMNDNGGTAGTKVFNAGMRGQKGTASQGGTRASSFWYWPGRLKPAKAGQLTAHIDVFPTLAELAGAGIAADAKPDGLSLVPLLQDPQHAWPDRFLVTHLGRWQPGAEPVKFGECSVRWREWELLRNRNKWLLFNLGNDPGEQHDVAEENPGVVARLSRHYDEWWQEVTPCLVNERAHLTAPAVNPFKEQFDKQMAAPTAQRAEPSRGWMPPAPQGKTWSLSWHDEFDGKEIDATKWNIHGDAPRKGGWWLKKNMRLDGKGLLEMMVTSEPGDRWGSGAIDTRRGKFQSHFGWWVCRMKLPKEVGYWPAFWIQSDTMHKVGNDGRDGSEIDVLEFPKRDGTLNMAIHWDGYGKDHKVEGSSVKWPEFLTGWHEFGVLWTPEEYVFYYDGKEAWRTRAGGVSQVDSLIILSTEVNGWAGDIRKARLPESTFVDWVRVYQATGAQS